MLTKQVTIDMMIYLTEFFSKELDDVLIFKWKSTEILQMSHLKWGATFDSYIQLYQAEKTNRLASLLDKKVLLEMASRFLGLDVPKLDNKKLTLIEEFMGWLINNKVVSFIEKNNQGLHKSRLVHAANHIYCFYEEEKVHAIHMNVLSGKKILGEFKLLASIDDALKEDAS